MKKIKINDHIDISVGRAIFGTIIFILTIFTNLDFNWVFLLFGIRIHKNNNKKTVEEVKDKNE